MAKDVRLRHRRRIRQKEVAPLVEAFESDFGMTDVNAKAAWEAAEVDPERMPIFLIGNDVFGLEFDGRLAPTVRALLQWPASKRWVTVDMGAVRFVTNGADTMAPGITDADPEIQPDDLVWIRDETHGKPLAIGQATMSGPELKEGTKGKVVRAVHFLGDPLWTLGREA